MMSNYIYVLVWKTHDGKFNLTRSFENKNLLEFYCNDNKINFEWDTEINKAGYYAYEVAKD